MIAGESDPDRLVARRGPKAIMAVAATLLTGRLLHPADDVPYRDLGADHLDRLDHGKLTRRVVGKLEQLGCDVDLKRAA